MRPAAIPIASNLDGCMRTAFDARYWRDQVREAVAFAEGMATLAGLGCDTFIEIGPQPVLCGLGRESAEGPWIASLRRGADDVPTIRDSAAPACIRGAPGAGRGGPGAA